MKFLKDFCRCCFPAACFVMILFFSLTFFLFARSSPLEKSQQFVSKIDVKHYPIHDLLPAGTLVALKSSDQENPAYVYFDGQNLKLKPGNFAKDPHCHFFIMRADKNKELFGFKINGWNNMYDDAASASVRIGKKTENFSDQTEQWVIKPKDASSLSSVILQNFGTGRFLYFSSLGNAQATVLSENAARLEIEVIKPVPGDINPGGSSFSFIPAVHKKNRILFHDNWDFTPGKLKFQIKVAGENNIFIVLSSEKKLNPAIVRIMIGQEGNTVTAIFAGEKKLFEAKNEPQSLVTTPEGSQFWIMLEGSTISFGKGKDVGLQLIAQVDIDGAIAKELKYVGIGGGGNPLTFSKIVINPEPPVAVQPHAEPAPQPKPVLEPIVPPVELHPMIPAQPETHVVPAEPEPVPQPVVVPQVDEKEAEPATTPVRPIKKRPVRSKLDRFTRGKKQPHAKSNRKKVARRQSNQLTSSQRIRAALKKKPAFMKEKIERDDDE